MGNGDKTFTLGMFGTLAIVCAILIFLWLLTFEDPETFYDLSTASFFLIGGVSFSFALVKVKLKMFNWGDFTQTMMITGLNVVVFLYINQLTPLQMGVTQGVLIGIAEECFFTLFLCGLMYRFTHNFFISVIASSAVWATYHINRYGGNMNIIWMIFLCGCVIRASFLYTRNADGAIFAHGVWNYIALS